MGTPDIFKGYHSTKGSTEDLTGPELRGRHGYITPYDSDTLAVFVEGARRFKKLAGASGAVVFTEGEAEGTVHLPNGLIELAASVIEARKKRTVKPETKERLKRIGAASRFGKTTAQEGDSRHGDARK